MREIEDPTLAVWDSSPLSRVAITNHRLVAFELRRVGAEGGSNLPTAAMRTGSGVLVMGFAVYNAVNRSPPR
jgi:hypothetical protein